MSVDDYGLKWTDGTDVSIATLENTIISSKYPCLKFSNFGTGSITYTHDVAGNDIVVATHNLGYNPQYVFLTQWFDIDNNVKNDTYRHAPVFDNLSDGAIYFTAVPYTTTTQLKYTVYSYNGSGSASITLKYIYIIYYNPEDE